MSDRGNEQHENVGVGVDELCQMLALSKRRFYELVAVGVFPRASAYSLKSRRPIFSREDVDICLNVRRDGIGINGQRVSFNKPRKSPIAGGKTVLFEHRKAAAKSAENQKLQAGEVARALRSLAVKVPTKRVEGLLEKLFPTGTAGVKLGDIVQSIYRQLSAESETQQGGN